MEELFMMKFRINDEEHSRQVQEHLFSLGYFWGFWEKQVLYTKAPYIYTQKGRLLCYGTISKDFDEDKSPEFKLVTSVMLEECEKVIRLFGKVYTEDQVKEALKNVKEYNE